MAIEGRRKLLIAARAIEELLVKAEGLTVKEALKLASSMNAVGVDIDKAEIKATQASSVLQQSAQ